MASDERVPLLNTSNSNENVSLMQASNGGNTGSLAFGTSKDASLSNKKKLSGKIGPKSLFFCLVLDSPFDPENPEHRVVDPRNFTGEAASSEAPATGISDHELLEVPPNPTLSKSKYEASSAPNKFQKIIEIILRLQTRGVDFLPDQMIRQVPNAHQIGFGEGEIRPPPNYHHGFELIEENLLLSPDKDEMYIKIHCSRKVLLTFAESQGVSLNTHPLSFAGGTPLPYSVELEKKLTESVELFCEAFPHEMEEDNDEGGAMGGADGEHGPMLHTEDSVAAGPAKKQKQYGFVLDVPDKMRLNLRLMREAWKYGGCGLQLAELKNKKVLVRHFFPLHNEAYQKAYCLDKWASFKQMFTRDPFYQVEDNILKYFGEEVALYFSWIRDYSRFLRFIAFFGTIAGILGHLGTSGNDELHSIFPISLINGLFAIICVVWGAAWNFRWMKHETTFATAYGQEAQLQQELVRDEFEKDKELPISIPDVFKMRFDFPMTLRTLPDGSMVDLHYSPWKRSAVRYLISYPVIGALCAGMMTALIYNTRWRFMYPEDDKVSYGSSIVSVLIGFVFGVMFDKMVPLLNSWENNRTDTEESSQHISKSFLFYFISYYFSMFTIALWPDNNSGQTNNSRLDQLASQMIIATLVKPMVQNVQELAMPWFNNQLRRRTDVYGSAIKALCSMLCCTDISKMERQPETPLELEGYKLWREAQLEPYESTSGDYLEITLQFGFMAMFASTFPFAALGAFLYNILEIRVDAKKLLYSCQRPIARPSSSIGSWNPIFVFISTLSVVTNSYLICMVSPFLKQLTLGLEDNTRHWAFITSQYFMVASFALMYYWWGGSSVTASKIKAKQYILSGKATRLRMAKIMREQLSGPQV